MNNLRFARFVLLVNGLVPATLLLWDVIHHQAGANPVNYSLRTTGILALLFLSCSLLVTPLRKLTGESRLFHLRRPLGLFAASYALVHFFTFFVFDRGMSVQDTLSEMVKRPYLVVGSCGLAAMLPLVATSTNAMIRKLGPKRWRALHRLAYVALVCGVVHFYMLVKSDIRLPVAFGVVAAVLLGFRAALFLAGSRERGTAPHGVAREAFANGPARWHGSLRVERIVQETPDIRTLHLVSPDSVALPFRWLPGQYLTLSLPIDGRIHHRSYTIASSPTQTDSCTISVKQQENGRVSRHLHGTIREGDLLSVAAPAGRFTFDGQEADAVALIGAGVGITPLMSILRFLTERRWPGRIYLLYSNRTEQDILFRDEIEALERQFPNLRVVMTLTRASGASWPGGVGRIDAASLAGLVPDLTAVPFYLCGPTDMLRSTRALLEDLGVAAEKVHTESFGTPPTTSPPGPGLATADGEFAVTFSRSNTTVTTDGGRSLLTLAEELDIQIDSECRSGVCGRCRCRLVSGAVSMENDEALSSRERSDGFILLCQARALADLVVEA